LTWWRRIEVSGEVAEAGQDVQPQMAAVCRPGGGTGLMSLLPDVHPFSQGDAPVAGVEEGVPADLDVDLLGP